MVRQYAEKHRRRTYVLHPQRSVLDHETGFESGDVEGIFDGDLDAVLAAGIRKRAAERAMMGNDMGPCSYCGNMYSQRNAGAHFIPCCYCQDLEHSGCRH